MTTENWANIRLSVSYVPDRQVAGRGRCEWRLSAKPPGADWTLRDTVAFGAERVDGVAWPPSRDDMLAMATEVLLGVRWVEPAT